jgi:hypothetical protein
VILPELPFALPVTTLKLVPLISNRVELDGKKKNTRTNIINIITKIKAITAIIVVPVPAQLAQSVILNLHFVWEAIIFITSNKYKILILYFVLFSFIFSLKK